MAGGSIPGHGSSSALFYDTIQIVSNTNKRDVSDVLDLWVHRRTPFLNYLKWGKESGGTQIEWIAEHQGRGYLISGTEMTGSAVAAIDVTSSDAGNTSAAVNQVTTGAILVGYSTDLASHVIFFVHSATATSSASGVVAISSNLCGTVDSGTKLYVLGNFVNEGSEPMDDTTQQREVITNNFAILREDFSITGSMAATDMHAVANETRHQLRMKLLRMQFYRERSIIFSDANQSGVTARSATDATLFDGVHSFIRQYNTAGTASTTGVTYDRTTRSLTESLFNDMCANLWDAGCMPNVVVGGQKQIRNFTDWDSARVRTAPSAKMAGHHVTKYLTDVGFELDLVPMPDFPYNALYILDTNQIRPRAKKGRKLFTEKLGKVGDFTQWQMLSEYSVECRGATQGTMGGAFAALT